MRFKALALEPKRVTAEQLFLHASGASGECNTIPRRRPGKACVQFFLHHGQARANRDLCQVIQILDTETGVPSPSPKLECRVVATCMTSMTAGACGAWLPWTSIPDGMMMPIASSALFSFAQKTKR